MKSCTECHHTPLLKIKTYKRDWFLCENCGNAYPLQRSFYPWSFLPIACFKKDKNHPESMYDYFTAKVHVDHSIQDAKRFIQTYVEGTLDLKDQTILDISGGNGHFIHTFKELGAIVSMTEINDRAMNYAKETLGIETFYYDFQKHDLKTVVQKKFDVIMLRAAIMFCDNLPKLIHELKECLNDKGLVIIEHSVLPTLGVLTRVQLDEFSYSLLRQPETVIRHFQSHDFDLLTRHDETDPTPYVYDHDLRKSWLVAHYFYEILGMLKLRHRPWNFSFRARDRRRSALFFRKR